MVIAFRTNSYKASEIDSTNWCDILLENNVTFGRSDPNSDPCGYRTVLVIKLAEKFYKKPGLSNKLLHKDLRYIRPKEVDLLALLEVGELDYVFIYRSVAEQHKLEYLLLPDNINLKKAELSSYYKNASVRLVGKKPGTSIIKTGAPIVYGVTIPKNSQNYGIALTFLEFMLMADGGGLIFEKNGQTFIVPSPSDTYEKLPERLKAFALPSRLEQ